MRDKEGGADTVRGGRVRGEGAGVAVLASGRTSGSSDDTWGHRGPMFVSDLADR